MPEIIEQGMNITEKRVGEHLISVIVPVYNVAPYLKECIHSLIKQTYKNMEIILVDDGSTDESGTICDSYARKDKRVQVIHKMNGGLSDARNAGLEVAKGDYIGFVDSDDTVELNMYSMLYHLCIENQVPVACARYDLIGEAEEMHVPDETGDIHVFSGEEFLQKIITCDPNIFATVSVWDRLYKSEIIRDKRFPKGKCYEDVVFSTKAILDAKQVVYINKSLYHYRIRKGSITNDCDTVKWDAKLFTDRLPLQLEQIRYLESNHYQILANTAKAMYYQELFYMATIGGHPEFEQEIWKILKNWKLGLSEIIRLPMGGRSKMIILLKMYFPRILRKYYMRH